MSLLGPDSILNINRGASPLGFGVIHPLPPTSLSYYKVRPVLSTPPRGSFLDLINISYEPFLLLLAVGGAALSFILYQTILNNGRRKKRETWEDLEHFILGSLVLFTSQSVTELNIFFQAKIGGRQ